MGKVKIEIDNDRIHSELTVSLLQTLTPMLFEHFKQALMTNVVEKFTRDMDKLVEEQFLSFIKESLQGQDLKETMLNKFSSYFEKLEYGRFNTESSSKFQKLVYETALRGYEKDLRNMILELKDESKQKIIEMVQTVLFKNVLGELKDILPTMGFDDKKE